MIDLTLNEKDREGFITKLYLKPDSNKYIIKYASGRLEEMDFSVHNFNVSLLKMEEQFLEYREDYVKNVLRVQSKIQMKKLVEALIAILGIYMTVNTDLPGIIQGILIAVLTMYTFLYQSNRTHLINYGRSLINVVNISNKFLQMKDNFKIIINDPRTGQEEDWYLLSLSTIEQLYDAEHVDILSMMMTDEVKEKEKEETEIILGKRMCL